MKAKYIYELRLKRRLKKQLVKKHWKRIGFKTSSFCNKKLKNQIVYVERIINESTGKRRCFVDENVVIYSHYLNINFGFANHQAFQMLMDETSVTISFEKVSHTAHHPYCGRSTNWKVQNGSSFGVSVPNSSGGQDVIGEYLIETADIFSKGYTRNGISNIAHVRFSSQMPKEKKEVLAEACLNRFLDIYRFMTFHGYGDNYLNNKVPVFKIQEGLLRNKTQFRQDSLSHGTFLTLPPEDAMQSFSQPTEVVRRIAERLLLDKNLRTFEVMINAGKKFFIYDEDYPLAILMFGTAFETFVQFRLIELCEKRGIDQLPTNSGKTKPYLEAIEKGNVGYLLEKNLCDLTGIKNIRAKQVCKEWDENAYKKRNRIIHRGDTNFSREDAKDAYLAVVSFIEFIHNLPEPT